MAINNAIIHSIDKPENQPATLFPRSSELQISGDLESLIAKVNATYNNRAGKVYGDFESDQQQYPFAGWLEQYLNGSLDFVQLTQQAGKRFQQALGAEKEALSCYLLFVRMQVLESDQLLVLMLTTAQAVTIDEQLELSHARQLDAGTVHLGAKINLTAWQQGEKGGHPISFVKPRAAKALGELFRQCLGCTEVVDSKEQTQALLRVFDDYCSQEGTSPSQVSGFKQQAYDYCQERVATGESVKLRELSCQIDNQDPDKFYNYAVDREEPLQAEIPADKRGLQRFIRYSGSMKGLSLSFSESLLGEQVRYDPQTDTLTLIGIPPTLRKQLIRSGGDD
jgi:nucleoid-associated protein